MKNKIKILFFVLIILTTASISGVFGMETQEEEKGIGEGIDYDNVAPMLAPVIGETKVTSGDTAHEQPDGIVTKKTAFPMGDGTYKVQLEAYTTGQVSTQNLSIPSDIVLVLDQSGSMSQCMECGQEMSGTGQHVHHKPTFQVETSAPSGTYYVKANSGSYRKVYYCNQCKGWFRAQTHSFIAHTQDNKYLPKQSQEDTNASHTQFYVAEQCSSRKTALTKALNAFVGEVCNKAAGEDGDISTDADNVNHRIAMVGFASEEGHSYQNTEIFIGSNHYTYGTSAQAGYKNAFQDMSTVQGQNNVAASISQIDAEGATYVNLGMEMANGILRDNPVPQGQQRNRVVVVFTDGAPGYNGTYDRNPEYGKNGDASLVANRAITQGNTTKNQHGATVYTVGIFSGADGTSSGNQNGTDSEKANWFMQQLSSNNGVPQNPGYYLSASDSDTLTNIFKQISQQICTPDIELGSETTVVDKVSPYFTTPADTKDINIYTAAFDGSQFNEQEESDLEATFQSDGTICVTGFDFNENFVSTTVKDDGTYGKKLIIEFLVVPKPGFLGGNGVPTNEDNAGVYAEDGTLIASFSKPKVDVPIKKVSVEAASKNVYLYGNLSTEQLKEGMEIRAGEGDNVVVIDLDKENYGLEKWQNEFVDISVSVVEEEYTNLSEDTDFDVTCKVLPKTGTGGKEGTATGKINVFTPVITFKDSVKYYGETIDESYPDNLVKTEWIHNETKSEDVNMYGQPPELTFSFQEDAGAIKDGVVNSKSDFGVKAQVKLGENDIENYVVIDHWDCIAGEVVPEGDAFLVHVKTCQITIAKTGGNPGEPYIFVLKRGEEKYTEGTIVGNGTLDICQLPVGTYTVEEEEKWSWRFTPSFEESDTVNLTCNNSVARIACRNQQENEQWLNGYSHVVTNVFETHFQNRTIQ